MVRRTHGSIDGEPLFGRAPTDLASDVIVYDTIEGTPGDDVIKGTEGSDSVFGHDGKDMLKGLGGDDYLYGEGGDDLLLGGDGNDFIVGDYGSNEIHGGDGDDDIESDRGTDTIYGGIGNNRIYANLSCIVYTIAGGIDQINQAKYWYVDYSTDSAGVTVASAGAQGGGRGLKFSTGSGIYRVDTYDVLLGSGDDTFNAGALGTRGSTMNAGGGSDTFSYIADTTQFNFAIARSADGAVIGSALNGRGTKVDSTYVNFETFHIVNHASAQRLYVDGALLYEGVHLDYDVGGEVTLDFTRFVGGVTGLTDAGVLTVNGSTFQGSVAYTITLNDLDGHVSASGTLTGGAGDDALTGLLGDDTISGNAGIDTIDGGDGNDVLDGGAADDTISGSAGNDRILGAAGLDTLDGGDGDDTIDGGDGDDTIQGGLGNDTIVASAGHNTVDGGDGADTIMGGADDETLIGSAGADHISGGLGHNIIDGGDDNDVLVSAAGAIDTVDGGAGADSWSGDDRAVIQAMAVTWDGGGLHVSDGTEVTNVETISLVLGSGHDVLTVSASSAGKLSFEGGGGSDTIDYSAIQGGGITLSLAATAIQNTGAGGKETITGFENVIGSAQNDTLTGTARANLLTGGEGADTLTGGAGADRFIVTGLADLGTSSNIDKIDRITDFSHTERDRIDLSAIDADPNTDGDQSFKFLGTKGFHTGGAGPGEIRYAQSIDGYLLVQGDIDHDGKADFSFLVHNTALVASDLVL